MREIGIDCGDASTRARGSNAEEIERRVPRRRRRRERRGGARRSGARDCGFETVCEKSVDGTRSIVGDEQRFTGGVAQESCRNERDEIEDASKDAATTTTTTSIPIVEAKPSVRASIALASIASSTSERETFSQRSKLKSAMRRAKERRAAAATVPAVRNWNRVRTSEANQ